MTAHAMRLPLQFYLMYFILLCTVIVAKIKYILIWGEANNWNIVQSMSNARSWNHLVLYAFKQLAYHKLSL